MKDATLFFFVTITLMFSRIDFSTFFFGFLFFFFSLVLLLKSVTGVLREHLLNGQPFKGCHQFDLLDLSLKILHGLRGESKLTQ